MPPGVLSPLPVSESCQKGTHLLVCVLLETVNSADQGCRKWMVILVMIEEHEEICWWVLSDLEIVL